MQGDECNDKNKCKVLQDHLSWVGGRERKDAFLNLIWKNEEGFSS